MNATERKRLIREIYSNTIRDYRSKSDEWGTGIMVIGERGTTIIYLENLSDDDLRDFHSERVK